MEFWGVEVKPGQTLLCSPGRDKYIHLSQVSLGETKKNANAKPVPIFVTFEGKKLVIGTLSSESCLQCSVDLVFEKDFELSHGWKDGSLFFIGYKTGPVDDEEFPSSESDEEMVMAAPIPVKTNGKPLPIVAAFEPKRDLSKPKVKSVEAITKDEDSEDDSDEDFGDESMSEDDDSEDGAAKGVDESDEDDSSEEEETPKKLENEKKRPTSVTKTPLPAKKAKFATPAGKTGGQGKSGSGKGGHIDTPHPKKQTSKSPANASSKTPSKAPETPKSIGSVSCKSCSKAFKSDSALQSHTKAKHAGK